jgi:DMSO/TMAO reductase YedYZ molybdopterin-dependent catalytic subunit
VSGRRHGRRRALLDGALAAAPGLAAGWVAHRCSSRIPFPPTSLADRIIRLTPGDVSTAAIDRLHHAAQQLLAGTLVAVFVVLAAFMADRLARTPHAAVAWAAALLAGGLATPVQPSTLGALGAAGLGGALFAASRYALRHERRGRPEDPARREAIAAIGAFIPGVLLASHPLGNPIGRPGRPRRLRAGLLPRAPIPARSPFPRIPGLACEITAVADHYVVDIDINDPVVDGPTWRLHIGGLVEQPLDVSFLDLQRDFALTEEISVLTCISNAVGGPLVGCSRWEGPRLREVLSRAQPQSGATGLVVRCADGYSAGIPLAAATHPSALLAIAQDGEALTRVHGFPCRLRLPALYGMLNPKWMQSIELVDRPHLGYWAQQGWSASAVVRTGSRIDTPRHARAGRPTWIAGVAWAGMRGVARVEVSTDGGRSWADARLHKPLSPYAWTQWAYRWTPPRSGTYRVTCRATNGVGATQDSRRRPPHPSGASGYHAVQIHAT